VPESDTAPDFSFARVHHVQLSIPPNGEDKARAFWSGTLGMTELPKPPVLAARGGCWFGGGGVEVHMGVEDEFAPARKAHPGIQVTGVRELAARLEARGIDVLWDDTVPGIRRFHTYDPFGNRLEFLEPEPSA
jgi:catechol 2,3-dioxygenase-like lactoylglutathione lyase family enzyme